jgi:DNA-directed RNA polymerase specialized sigma subunit
MLLGTLPARWRDVVRRRYIGGEGQREIGASLGVTDRQVSNIETDAMKRLAGSPLLACYRP